MKKLFKYLKPFTPMIIVAIILTFCQGMLNLYLPNLMSDIVNNGIVGQSLDEVYKYGKQMVLVTLGFMCCAIGATFMASRVSAGFGKKLKSAI